MTPSFHHTGLTVSDLAESIRFYQSVLGLELVASHEMSGGYFGAIVGDPAASARIAHLAFPKTAHRLELIEYRDRGHDPSGDSRAYKPWRVGPTHLSVVVESVAAVWSRIEPAGGSIISQPIDIDAGPNSGGRAAYVRDPDGIIIELFELPAGRPA